MGFGEWLRSERQRRALPTRRFAALVGCSPAMISAIELGRKAPSDRLVKSLAAALEVHPMELLTRLSTHVDVVRAARGHPHQGTLPELIRATRELDDEGIKALLEAARQQSRGEN